MIEIEANKRRFTSLLATVDRGGVDGLMDWLDSTDAYSAPCSTRHHLAEKGGLIEHSLSVYDTLCKLDDTFCTEFESDSMVITALTHDFCKVDYYVPDKKWNKDTGAWRQIDIWSIRDSLPLGHGNKSLYLVSKFIDLTDDEAAAIVHHMTCWNPSVVLDYSAGASFNTAVDKYPLVTMLSAADWISSRLIEGRE